MTRFARVAACATVASASVTSSTRSSRPSAIRARSASATTTTVPSSTMSRAEVGDAFSWILTRRVCARRGTLYHKIIWSLLRQFSYDDSLSNDMVPFDISVPIVLV